MMRLFIAVVVVLLTACTKQESTGDLTGTWHSAQKGVTYSFFDDSRFQQSDLPGEQWIWERDRDRVHLYGTPRRLWIIEFLTADQVQVIEQDTFQIVRQ